MINETNHNGIRERVEKAWRDSVADLNGIDDGTLAGPRDVVEARTKLLDRILALFDTETAKRRDHFLLRPHERCRMVEYHAQGDPPPAVMDVVREAYAEQRAENTGKPWPLAINAIARHIADKVESGVYDDVEAAARAALREAVHPSEQAQPSALPLNRLLVEFTLPDDTRNAAEEVFDFLNSAEQLGATPDGLGWRDADIGELRIWSEGMEPEPEGVTSLRSTFRVRDDLGRELETAALAWAGGSELAYDCGLVCIWPWVGDAPRTTPPIVSKKPLDKSKTYLVIVVEHPDEAIRG